MARMNKRTRDRLYPQLVAFNGERCAICRRKGNKATLVIDHIDNDNGNNLFENLQLLCRSDNTKKGREQSHMCMWGRMGDKQCATVDEAERERTKPRASSAEMEKSSEAQPVFRHWLYNIIRLEGELSYEDVLDCGAEAACVSQETIRRYFKKCCSRLDGWYMIAYGQDGKPSVVRFKPKYRVHLLANQMKSKADGMEQTKLLLMGSSTKILSDNFPTKPDSSATG